MTKGKHQASTSQPTTLDFISHSPEQTRRVGWRLGQHAQAGDRFLLVGTFGAGKTVLTQGIAAGLEVNERVTSPSFALINEHEGLAAGAQVRLYHIDLYRLETAAAIDSLGLDDLFADPEGICVIEWPERLGQQLTQDHLLILLEAVSETKRRLALVPHGARYTTLLNAVRAEAFGVGS